jgi:hypothetical protein
VRQIGPLVGKRTSAAVPRRLGGQDKGIRIRVYETFSTLLSRDPGLPDPGVGQQVVVEVGRTGYSRTDEAAEGMKKHAFFRV